MAIKKVKIRNFKCFKGMFEVNSIKALIFLWVIMRLENLQF